MAGSEAELRYCNYEIGLVNTVSCHGSRGRWTCSWRDGNDCSGGDPPHQSGDGRGARRSSEPAVQGVFGFFREIWGDVVQRRLSGRGASRQDGLYPIAYGGVWRRSPSDAAPAMTDLVLVRHGETAWHYENRYAGTSDIQLSDRGHEQAQDLARWAAQAKLDAIWCSELQRSQKTARYCEVACGLHARVDLRLNELDFGRCEGLSVKEIRQRFPEEARAFEADPLGHPLPGGEDPLTATARSIACIREIVEEFQGGRVLVVAHNTLIRLVLCHLLGVPLAEYRIRFPSLHNCALNEIRIPPTGSATLLRYNAMLSEDSPRVSR